MEITSLINPVFSMIKDVDQWKANNGAIKRMLLVECKYNLKVIDIAEWKNTSQEFKNYILQNLQCQAAEVALSFAGSGILDALFQSSGKDELENHIESIITKVKTLKLISNLPEKFVKDNKADYEKRIENLSKKILEIIKLLEK